MLPSGKTTGYNCSAHTHTHTLSLSLSLLKAHAAHEITVSLNHKLQPWIYNHPQTSFHTVWFSTDYFTAQAIKSQLLLKEEETRAKKKRKKVFQPIREKVKWLCTFANVQWSLCKQRIQKAPSQELKSAQVLIKGKFTPQNPRPHFIQECKLSHRIYNNNKCISNALNHTNTCVRLIVYINYKIIIMRNLI